MTFEKKDIYDELSRILTEYEEGIIGEEDLYYMLIKIQNNWETVITAKE